MPISKKIIEKINISDDYLNIFYNYGRYAIEIGSFDEILQSNFREFDDNIMFLIDDIIEFINNTKYGDNFWKSIILKYYNTNDSFKNKIDDILSRFSNGLNISDILNNKELYTELYRKLNDIFYNDYIEILIQKLNENSDYNIEIEDYSIVYQILYTYDVINCLLTTGDLNDIENGLNTYDNYSEEYINYSNIDESFRNELEKVVISKIKEYVKANDQLEIKF